jgi:diadenylate cyclase
LSTFWDQAQSFIWNIFNRPRLADWIDILIVAYFLYQLILLTRQTRASQVIKGFAVLILANWFSDILGLTALNWVLRSVVNNGTLVLVILFQPEIRHLLEQLGRGAKIEKFQDDDGEGVRIINEITQCLLSLSRRRVGALLVFEQRTGLKDVIETGTRIDAEISAPLLENIFEPNAPLHDGAVIVSNSRLMAAGCVLMLSDSSNISRELGTRHRAALGVSESTDAIVIIVSEETGIISLARSGKLTRHLDAAGISQVLGMIYRKPSSKLWDSLRMQIKRRLHPHEQE